VQASGWNYFVRSCSSVTESARLGASVDAKIELAPQFRALRKEHSRKKVKSSICPSSEVAWLVKNNSGLISGITENGKHDPLNETWWN
jgi:hypothetical protein